MTSLPPLAPLLVNAKTGEPYLRLPPPYSNIIMTPPRMSDADATISILNDERVWKWLCSPPYPYTPEDANVWIKKTSTEAKGILRELQENPGGLVGGCPVRILREVQEDGEEVFLGDLGVDRDGWSDIGDRGERERLVRENSTRLLGDPEIMWCIGDYLAPSHHGKGIMTAALRMLLHDWMVPRMGAKKVKGTAYKGNTGSKRVFEKNGFVLEKTLEDYKEISESKGGGKVGLYVMQCQL